MYEPSYRSLYDSGELARRADTLKTRLASCDICPRTCHINRYEAKNGYCRSGNRISVSSYCDHHGEEPALSGTRGSGTIFFHSCNLACIYCQNYQISQGEDRSAKEIDSRGLAEIMLSLQDEYGCHNINFVSPSHFAAQIVDALCHAVPMGLKIPLVYNTNAYDSLATLKLLDGVIDIYLPDIKYASDKWAVKFSQAKNYVLISRAAIKEMYKQVGNLQLDALGVAQRGLIVRHLILPENLAGSSDSLRWLAQNLSKEVTVSIMAQYHPCHKAYAEPLLSRKITGREYRDVIELVEQLDIENGWLQQMESSDLYLPDFNREGHPFHKDPG